MKALTTPVMLVSLLTLQACSMVSDEAAQPTTETSVTVASLEQPNTIKPQTFVMRGEVVLGHEAQSIQPCGSEKQYWLAIDHDKFMQAQTLISAPYQPMYGEMVGYLETSSRDGFDADYDARFVVEQVNLLTAENPNRCERPLQKNRAFGNEPFWSLDFNNSEISFQPMGGQKQNFAVTQSRFEANRRRYDFANGQLELNLRSCNDGMSDSIYGWSASLQVGEKQYHGCATLSNQDATLNWTGTYQATSTQSAGFSVILNMLSDHSATTTYRYQDNSGDLVERGYWQQLSPQQVQVVMTHHQQQPLLSERLFIRDGYQLTADKEKVGNVVYPIADGGLTLFKTKQEFSADQITTPPASPAPLTEALAVTSSAQFDAKVDSALRNYFTMHKTDPAETRYRWLTYDLNGDGQDELLTLLDWCGSGGCTLLVFENHQQQWRFNSRMTLVNTPFYVGQQSQNGWRDLIMPVRGGGATPELHQLRYNGISYPLNPSTAPIANQDNLSPVTLFSDGLVPQQEGAKL